MSKNIKKFVNRTIHEIQESLPEDFEIADEIKFEISVVTSTKGSGGLDIKLASGKFDKSKEIVHKIEFSVTNKVKDEEARLTQLENALSGISRIYDFVKSFTTDQKPNSTQQIQNQ